MQVHETDTKRHVLKLTSTAFQENGLIPTKYTCDGKNVNPPLEIESIPADVKSLVLIVEDPDAPVGTWLHWILWNIPVTHIIHENEAPGIQGKNDFGNSNYGGPCPPGGTHRYVFKIYGLNELIDLPKGSSRNDVDRAMREHLVAYGELMGRYKRSRK
jgi:Raf kinase inhibitor-like YbhB/YbcL family protein